MAQYFAFNDSPMRSFRPNSSLLPRSRRGSSALWTLILSPSLHHLLFGDRGYTAFGAIHHVWLGDVTLEDQLSKAK